MKNIITAILVSIFFVSCGNETKNATLEDLTNQKKQLINSIDSLNSELKKVEKEISKIDTNKKLTNISVLPLKTDLFKHFVEIQGIVQADKNIEIKPELGGTVENIYVKEGQNVVAGQLLMQLDDAVINNSIDELKTQLALANTTFERQKRLWEQQIGSEMQFLQAKTQKETLENNLESLKTQSNKMKITAPFSGIVDEIFPKIGELTSPQMSVIRLINLDNVYIEADVTETYLPIIKVGTETNVYFSSIDKEVDSKIAQVGNYINPNNRSFKTRINITNTDKTIKPNLLADVKILDFQQNGIIIPSTLVQEDQSGNKFVFSVKNINNENVITKNVITIGNEYNNEVLITEGLTEKDTLVNAGARLVKEGDTVNIVE